MDNEHTSFRHIENSFKNSKRKCDYVKEIWDNTPSEQVKVKANISRPGDFVFISVTCYQYSLVI